MHLFTWNVQGDKYNTLEPLALKHLDGIAKNDNVIAVFQECNWSFSSVKNTLLEVVPSIGKKDLRIVYSRKLKLIDYHPDRSERALITRFEVPSGGELRCVGVHWHSRGREGMEDGFERGGAMALFRHYLDAELGAQGPAIIMGDFNADPFVHEREMCSPYCLFVKTRNYRGHPSKGKNVMGQHKLPWCLVESNGPLVPGTYFYKNTQKWMMFDQVLLTRDLEPRLETSSPKVHRALGTQKFLTKNDRTRGRKFASDHLPFECKIHFQ